MFGRLFHKHEVEPSGASSVSTAEQHPALRHPSTSAAAAAGPSFVAPHSTPHSTHQSFAAAQRQPSRQQVDEQEDGDEDNAEADEAEQNFVVSKPAPRPALLQVKSAAEYSAEASPEPLAPSAPSAASMRQPAAKQTVSPPPSQPAAAAAAAKPWKVDRPRQQQQQQQQQLQRPAVMPYQQQQQQQQSGVEELQKQLVLEAKAREELEDMLLRYERQLKAEIQARQAAESAAAEALAAMGGQQPGHLKGQQHSPEWQQQQEQLQQDRAALESMRADFEAQLHTARSEVAKAQAAMSSNEAQIRAEAAAACERLAADYEARLAMMGAELERTQQELAVRTHTLAGELNRWKRQATAAATAVLEAKDEVLLRKKELDSHRDKMDVLLDKLYAGKEANASLTGAIQQLGSYYGVPYSEEEPHTGAGTSKQHAGFSRPRNPAIQRELPKSLMQRAQAQQGTARRAHTQPQARHQQQQHHGAGPGGFFLPPAVMAGMPGPLVSYPSMLPWQAWGGSAAGGMHPAAGSMHPAGGLPVGFPGWHPQQQQQQQLLGAAASTSHMRQQQQHLHQQYAATQALPSISRHQAVQQQQQQQQSVQHAPAATKGGQGKGGSYAQQFRAGHTTSGPAPSGTAAIATPSSTSRLPRYAAATKDSSSLQPGSRSAAASSGKKPDRFKEASRNVAMISAIASRW